MTRLERERVKTSYFDTAILRRAPSEFENYPSGWQSPEIEQIKEHERVRFFTGLTLGDRKKTNLESAGCFSGDQTGVFESAALHISGSRLKREHYCAFFGTTLSMSAGCRTWFCEALEPASEPSDDDIGLVLRLVQRYDVHVPARQHWHVDILLPDAAIHLLPRLELLRVTTEWTVTRTSL